MKTAAWTLSLLLTSCSINIWIESTPQYHFKKKGSSYHGATAWSRDILLFLLPLKQKALPTSFTFLVKTRNCKNLFLEIQAVIALKRNPYLKSPCQKLILYFQEVTPVHLTLEGFIEDGVTWIILNILPTGIAMTEMGWAQANKRSENKGIIHSPGSTVFQREWGKGVQRGNKQEPREGNENYVLLSLSYAAGSSPSHHHFHSCEDKTFFHLTYASQIQNGHFHRDKLCARWENVSLMARILDNPS